MVYFGRIFAVHPVQQCAGTPSLDPLLRAPSSELALNIVKFRASTLPCACCSSISPSSHCCVCHFLSEWKLWGVLSRGCACCALSVPGWNGWAARCCGQERWWKGALGTPNLKVPMTFMPSTGSAWVIVTLWDAGTALCARVGAPMGSVAIHPIRWGKCFAFILPSLFSVQVKTLGVQGLECDGF